MEHGSSLSQGEVRSGSRSRQARLFSAIYDALTRRAPYSAGPKWANYAGLSLARIAVYNTAFRLRASRTHPSVASYAEAMARDGVCVIPQFLPERRFQQVADAYERLVESGRVRVVNDFNGTGIRWTRATLNAEDSDARIILEATVEHPTLIRLAEAVMRRKSASRPTAVLQILEVGRDGCDLGDDNSMLHADRIVPCLKAFLYINRNQTENGAYVYCPGSHRLTLPRLLHEYKIGVEEARFWKEGQEERARVSPSVLRSMRVEEREYGGPANTLVVANGLGFHRRGQLRPGTARKQIQFGFRHLEEPLLAEAVRAAVGRVNKLTRRT